MRGLHWGWVCCMFFNTRIFPSKRLAIISLPEDNLQFLVAYSILFLSEREKKNLSINIDHWHTTISTETQVYHNNNAAAANYKV